MSCSPTVTVLLPAYNAADWVGAAVDSVLNQSFRDFELLAIDDGSKDATSAVLAKYPDPRIRVVRHETNRGLVAVLNHGIDLAKGKYIARMDADDLAHARRLERQIQFMEQHHDVGICGTWFRVIGSRRPTRVRPPTEHDEIAALLFFRSALGHPTVMFRRELLDKTGLRYDPSASHAEDFDLWIRARERTRFANLPEYLLEYRVHPDQASAEYLQPQADAAGRIRLEQLALMLPGASDDEKRLHVRVCEERLFFSKSELLDARSWLDVLEQTNCRTLMFPTRAFGQALSRVWSLCCYRTTLAPQEVLRIYITRRYAGIGIDALRRHYAFALRTLQRAVTG